MSRIEREKRTVRKMIELYCRHHLHQDTMPEEYQHLAEFACQRLDHCRYGEQKTACKDCPTHCYAPKEREAIREVMRWAGDAATNKCCCKGNLMDYTIRIG